MTELKTARLLLPALTHAPDQDPATAYILTLRAHNSRAQMTSCLKRVASLLGVSVFNSESRRLVGRPDLVPWHELTPNHLTTLVALLASGYSKATVNIYIAALRGVIRQTWVQGLISAERRERLLYNLKMTSTSKAAQAAGRRITPSEMKHLFSSLRREQKIQSHRDAAIFACARFGLRRIGIASLNVVDYGDDGEGGRQLVVRSKADQERTVPVANEAVVLLEKWLSLRGVRVGLQGALFVPINKGGRLRLSHMTPTSISNMMKRRALQFGMNPFTPHDWRRTYAGDLLDAGVDLATVQTLMGHASPTTTSGYDRRGERVKAEASSLLHIPGV